MSQLEYFFYELPHNPYPLDDPDMLILSGHRTNVSVLNIYPFGFAATYQLDERSQQLIGEKSVTVQDVELVQDSETGLNIEIPDASILLKLLKQIDAETGRGCTEAHHVLINQDGIFHKSIEGLTRVEFPDEISVSGSDHVLIRHEALARMLGAKVKAPSWKPSYKPTAGEYVPETLSLYRPPCESREECLQGFECPHADIKDLPVYIPEAPTAHWGETAGGRYVEKKRRKKSAKPSAEGQLGFDVDNLLPSVISVRRGLQNEIDRRIDACVSLGCQREKVDATTVYTRAGKPLHVVKTARSPKRQRDNTPIGLKGYPIAIRIFDGELRINTGNFQATLYGMKTDNFFKSVRAE